METRDRADGSSRRRRVCSRCGRRWTTTEVMSDDLGLAREAARVLDAARDALLEVIRDARAGAGPDALTLLAQNLAVGGALCAAREVALTCYGNPDPDWEPGCGRPSPLP